MKYILSCCLLLAAALSTNSLSAQIAREGNIRFAKVDRPGLMADYPYSKDVVESALRSRLEKGGLGKSKSQKGFEAYQGATWIEIAPEKLDVYTNVEGKGGQSTVLLLVSKGYDNYISAASDPTISAKLKAVLDGLTTNIQAEQLLADMRAQEEAIRRAEKAYKDIDEDGNKLSRDRERIEKQQADNAIEKSKRAEALNAEKAKLETLRAQIKQ